METFTKGSIVLVPFPFSDLSSAKYRPALIMARVSANDVLLAQITSKQYSDPHAIELKESFFVKGSLERVSFVRPGKLFTASSGLIIKEVGSLNSDCVHIVVEAVIELLRKN